MSLAVAIQMDPVESIDIDADSTFVLALEAQRRGHGLYHYLPQSLSFRDGRVYARARPLEMRRKHGDHATLGQPELIDLAALDVVLMRQDPPFDMAYITATHLLEHIHPATLVINDPVHVRNAPEKLFVAHFGPLMPPTLISSDRQEILDFRVRAQRDIIVKPLFGNGGAGVFHIGPEDENLSALLELFTGLYREPIIVQALSAGGTRRATSASSWSTENAAGAVNRVPPAGRGARQSCTPAPNRRKPILDAARPGDLRGHRSGLEKARPDLRRHRRHRRLPDRDQRDLADRAPGDQPLQRGFARIGHLGCHRGAPRRAAYRDLRISGCPLGPMSLKEMRGRITGEGAAVAQGKAGR